MATLQVKAIFDCEGDRIGELSFKEGDILVDVIESNEEGWYEGRLENSSERGLFPFNYVEVLKPQISVKTPPRRITVSNQYKGKPKNSDNSNDGFNAYPKMRNVMMAPRLYSDDKIAVKESSDLAPTISPLKATPRRIEEIPKPEKRTTTSNVLEKIQQKSEGIRHEISSMAQNYSSPPLSNRKYVKINREMISPPLYPRREQEITKKEDLRQLYGINHVQSVTIDDNQLVKPSHLGNNSKKKIFIDKKPILSPRPPALSPRPSRIMRSRSPILTHMDENPFHASDRDVKNEDKLLVSSPKNPMPPLPSRPTSVASRKSQANRTSNNFTNSERNMQDISRMIDVLSLNSEEKEIQKEDETNTPPIRKSNLPAIKPKPNTLRPPLPLRSASSQSPAIPKLESKPVLLLSKSDDALETQKKCSPTIPARPSISLKTTKPPPPQKPAKSSRTKMNCQPSANEKDEQENSVDSKLSINKEMKAPEKITLLNNLDKKKAPPPPPPSRPPRKQERTTMGSKMRYEILFETIQDNGYINEDLAQTIWRKNRLSKEEMDYIWRECDSGNRKLLDKDAFINSMRMIDTLLSRKEHDI